VFGREHRRGPGHGAAAEFTAEIQRHRNGHHGVEDGAVDLLPVRRGKKGTPFRDARQMAEGIIYRYRCGIAWRDVPEVFGPWQTIWTWHRRMRAEGTWAVVLSRSLSAAEDAGIIDWAAAAVIPRSLAPISTPRTSPPHRGLGRITRISASSRLTTALAVPVAAGQQDPSPRRRSGAAAGGAGLGRSGQRRPIL
jgi:hypothetical protein